MGADAHGFEISRDPPLSSDVPTRGVLVIEYAVSYLVYTCGTTEKRFYHQRLVLQHVVDGYKPNRLPFCHVRDGVTKKNCTVTFCFILLRPRKTHS